MPSCPVVRGVGTGGPVPAGADFVGVDLVAADLEEDGRLGLEVGR